MVEIVALRLIHILAGSVWVGSAVFSGFLLVPVLTGLGPDARPVMEGLRSRGLFVLMPTMAILTILSGARLMWIASGGLSGAYFTTRFGATYGVAGAAAVLAFVLGMTLSRPHGARVGALSAELSRARDEAARTEISARLARARRRGTLIQVVLTALLLGSAAGMSVARYLG